MLLEIGIVIAILISIVYIYFKFFYKNTGRLHGGVYVIFAPPGEGKSYIATALALKFMEEGRKVFTNYPVVSIDGEHVSMYWERQFMEKNACGSVIIIDEAYRDYSSREFKSFTKDDHTWFATTGHNEISLYLITQNPQRIDLIIREVVNVWLKVRKVEIPILEIPLLFVVDAYLSEMELAAAAVGRVSPYYTERYWFKKRVALAYDTRFFRKDKDPPLFTDDWITHLRKIGFDYEAYQKVNLKDLYYSLVYKIKVKFGLQKESDRVPIEEILLKLEEKKREKDEVFEK